MKVFSLLALAAAAAALPTIGAARAEESVTILENDPARTCSEAAAVASRIGTASEDGVAACTRATLGQPLTGRDLAGTYLNRGVLYLVRGEARPAIEDFNQALQLQPNLSQALMNRGAAFQAQGRAQDAIADFTQALALSPTQPALVYYDRAIAREDAGDLKGAYLDYRKAAQLDPGWDRPRKELARFTVARPAQG